MVAANRFGKTGIVTLSSWRQLMHHMMHGVRPPLRQMDRVRHNSAIRLYIILYIIFY